MRKTRVKENKIGIIPVGKYKSSSIRKFREKWLKKGFELVDITQLCTFKLGNSGWCNDFNEPDENIYHIQCWYRDDIVANFSGLTSYVIDDDKYLLRHENEDDYTGADFIIFRKVKMK